MIDTWTQIQNITMKPIELLVPQLARANKNYKCAIDLAYAYAPFIEETIKHTSFSFRNKIWVTIEVSMVSKVLQT